MADTRDRQITYLNSVVMPDEAEEDEDEDDGDSEAGEDED